MAEVPAAFWDSPHGPVLSLAVHRLWAGRKIPEITYAPDHKSAVRRDQRWFCIAHEDHFDSSNYSKELTLKIDHCPPRDLNHRLKNLVNTAEVLPWANYPVRMGESSSAAFKGPCGCPAVITQPHLVLLAVLTPGG